MRLAFYRSPAAALAIALTLTAALATATSASAASDVSVYADQAVIAPGQVGTYVVYVDNNGPSATSVPLSLTDTLNSNDVSFVAASGTGWSCTVTAKSLNCTMPDALEVLEPAGDLTVTISGPATPGTYGTHQLQLTGPDDPDTSDNVVTDSVRVAHPVDAAPHLLTQAMTAGQSGKLRLTAQNTGTDLTPAPISVAVTLPPSVAFVAAAGPDWSCTPAGPVITCLYSKSVEPFKSTPTLSMTVTPSREGYPRADITAHLTMAGDQYPDNDSIVRRVAVSTYPDLGVAATAPVNPLAWIVGTWTVMLNHTGPSMGGPTTVTISGSPNLGVQGAAGPAWTCAPPVGQAVTCSTTNVNQLPALTLNAFPKDGAPASVTVTVAGTGDGDPSNNSATATATPTWAPDLRPQLGGRRGAVTMSVRNDGASPNNGEVRVTARVARGGRFSSASGRDWRCRTRRSTLRCRTERLVFPSGLLPVITAKVRRQRHVHRRSARVRVTVRGASDVNAGNDTVSAPVRLGGRRR